MRDNINPTHYTSDPSGVECIQITRHRNFNIGNAFKYLWRAGLKGGADTQIEDLHKAIWYIQDEIKRLEGTTEQPTEPTDSVEYTALWPIAKRVSLKSPILCTKRPSTEPKPTTGGG